MKRIRLAVAAVCAALATAGNAAAATAVSSNWSGYAATGTFSKVTGTWVQPAVSCTGTSSSAFWVGLGGDSETSTALEQAGTEADCNANGTVAYSAWYELVPAASVKVPLEVSAGDTITATVAVAGTQVTVDLRDATSGKTIVKTLRMASPDVSSVEWIAEAPSVETPMGVQTLPLADFGTVAFTNASATSASGVTGSIAHWHADRIELQSGGGFGHGHFGPDQPLVQALPTALRRNGSAFGVTWSAV